MLPNSNPYNGETVVDGGVLQIQTPGGLGIARTETQSLQLFGTGGTFTLTKKGSDKVSVHLSGPGKALLVKDGGHLTGSIVVGVKVSGTLVTGPSHKLKISTQKGKKK